MNNDTPLNRSLTLPTLTLYGLGTIIGAGIYVLLGKVAGQAGVFLPFAFILAGVIAIFTALSYSELAARYPHSGGSAIYVAEAWGYQPLAQVVGVLVALTGIVSAATITNGFVGYLDVFIELSPVTARLLLIALLGLLAGWGIKQSAAAITVITLLEVLGLVYVIILASQTPAAGDPFAPSLFTADVWPGIFVGAFLAFYAFIGFEDMVNVVEEVKQPTRTVPRAIILSVGFATVLYVLLAIVAVRSTPVSTLAASAAPLSVMVSQAGVDPGFITVISLFAVINGALVQVIMSSRLLYGMARRNMAPNWLARVNPVTRTPLLATGLVLVIILAFALWLPLVALASLTSAITLSLFALVNASLIHIKHRHREQPSPVNTPLWVPVCGLLLCVVLLVASVG